MIRAVADLVSLLEPRLVELWKETGVTFSQRRVLRRLVTGPRSAGDLAAELGVAAPTLTRHLQRLEERGFLSREMDRADRRRILVALTDAGQRLLSGHRGIGGTSVASGARDLTVRQRRELIQGLTQLVRAAREHEVAAAHD